MYDAEKYIYKTTLSEDIWQLFVDDEMMMAGRWPNANYRDNDIWDQEISWAHGSVDSEFGKMATTTNGTYPNLGETGLDFTEPWRY